MAGIIAADPAMVTVFSVAQRLAKVQTTVLVTGETGVGKEVVAEQIHRWSGRADKPFIRLNCASLPVNLVESELFGHEKAAFTGATHRKLGYVEAAHLGTLLLDEIGELPLTVQAKLLRVLETKRVSRLGGVTEIPVDVRFVCATHRDLQQEVTAGRFREDLLYRINTFTLEVPPLRQRRTEVRLLAHQFIQRFAAQMQRPAPTFSPEVSRHFDNYAWPGNVRELKNAIEHALVMADNEVIRLEHLPDPLRSPVTESSPQRPALMRERLDLVEKQSIEQALEAEGGNQTRAAKRLGISRRAFIRKLEKHGLKKR